MPSSSPPRSSRRFDFEASQAFRSVPIGLRWAGLGHPKLPVRVRADLSVLASPNVLAGAGLVIAGPALSGKSSLAVALFRAYLASATTAEEALHRDRARFVAAAELEGDCPKRSWWRRWVRPARGVAGPLLLLDGVGEEGSGLAAVRGMMEARLAERLPLWITTRLRRRGLEMRYGARLVDKLFERASSLELDWTFDPDDRLRRRASSSDDGLDEEDDTIELPSIFPSVSEGPR